ncbi:MAG: T9SS type A sorting domain-containing protein [Flavobacteriales bacterium]|nr:T9SS type A sorting domain-containing protein [Flavobacteriales bacterium]
MSNQNILRLAIGASLSLVASLVASQTFNKVHYNVASGFANGHAVREYEDGYLVFGLQTELDTVAQDCSVTRFDLNGNFTDENYLHRPRIEIFGGYADPIASLPSGNGFVAAQTTFSGGIALDTVFLVRFNPNGDTLWTKRIISDSLVYVRKTHATANHYYFTGLYHAGAVYNSAFLLRTDTFANVQLTHFYPQIETLSLTVDDAGYAYLAGRQNSVYPKGMLLKIDTLGNTVWSSLQDRPIGTWFGVKSMFNDKVLCLGGWNESYPEYWLPNINTMYLSMYDVDGNLLWDYEGLRSRDSGGMFGQFTDGYQDTDSTFIAAGAIQQLFWNRAVIYRFNADGDSLWRRDYAHFGNLSALYPEVPWDIEPTSDGGMVLTGTTYNLDSIPPYSNQNMWILKLDSLGCLVPGCQYVGINELAYGLEDALTAWPNPGHGQINLTLTLPEGLPLVGNLQLQVFDALGRLVLRKVLGSQRSQTIPLDLQGQAPGLYSAHISDDRMIFTGTKLILE